MKKITNPFRRLSPFEWGLWLTSLTVVTLSFLLSPERDLLSLFTSLIGVTALIFVSKGMVFGQVLCVIFAIAYGIVSYYFSYYGEMITYLGMSAPAAVASIISWLKNPYGDGKEVAVARLTKRNVALTATGTVLASVLFYFILGALDTANLIASTISVTTSFIASYLTFLRSPFYALGYAANDIVLIVLWVMAALSDSSYIPMVICFVMFFANDMYGFFNWRRIQSRQFSASQGK